MTTVQPNPLDANAGQPELRDVRRVAVFCGSTHGAEPAYTIAAEEIGRLLAQAGLGVVYGGGNVGLMGVVADAALSAEAEVIGVIPRRLVDREMAHPGLTELHVTETMHERKALMGELADAFVVLPGGLGTLEEIFEVLTWEVLGYHDKRSVFVDTGGFWEGLFEVLERMTDSGFIARHTMDRITRVATPGEALGALGIS